MPCHAPACRQPAGALTLAVPQRLATHQAQALSLPGRTQAGARALACVDLVCLNFEAAPRRQVLFSLLCSPSSSFRPPAKFATIQPLVPILLVNGFARIYRAFLACSIRSILTTNHSSSASSEDGSAMAAELPSRGHWT